MSLAPAPAPAPAPGSTRTTHFDTVRGQYYTKPIARGWSHLLWFALCLAFGPWAIFSHHGTTRVLGLTIYVVAIAGLFGTSAIYHCGTWSAAASRRLQRVDHIMIFFMIAGTATAPFLQAWPGTLGLVATIGIWTMAVGFAVIHVHRMQVPEKLTGAAFLILGWTSILVIPSVWLNLGAPAAILLLIGGLLYTVGTICYHRRSPDPFPTVFGYHEVFHVFVCTAAACQFIAITVCFA
jgi:hemolysin III